MAIFDRLDRVISRTADKAFAIRFDFYPMRSRPNGRSGNDSSRPAWQGRGILEQQPVYDSIETGKRERRGNDLHTLHAGAALQLSVDVHSHSEATEARQRDRIELADGRTFEIVATKPDGLARVVFALVALREARR